MYKKRIRRKLKLIAFLVQYFSKKLIYTIKPRLPKAQRVYAQQFPAVTLRPDGFSHLFNFSAELIVIALVLAVAAFNMNAFGWFGLGESKRDESLAAKLLASHDEWNPKLSAHHNSIKTIVLGSNSIIPRAYAAESTDSSEQTAPEGDDDVSLSFNIDEDANALVKPNTGRVKGLVNIQVYTTQVGDTLSGIAEKYHISTNTVKWANNLPNDTIKPGWYLKILPTDGILVKAGQNTTIPDLAYKYSANVKQIISYNGLESALDIEPEDIIIIPGGKMPASVVAKVAPKPGKTPTSPKEKLAPSKGHIFVAGQCTDYVARKKYIPWGGNAKNWIANSKAYGATVDRDANPGDIIVTAESRYGHVGYVESVNGDNVTFSEWNYAGPFKKTVRTLNVNSSIVKGIIHY